jgi:hypothetical protein
MKSRWSLCRLNGRERDSYPLSLPTEHLLLFYTAAEVGETVLRQRLTTGPKRHNGFRSHTLASKRCEDAEQGLAQLVAGGRNEMRVPKVELATISADHYASRLADKEHPGRHVPGLNLIGPKCVERAGREVGQVERGRARSADRLAALHGFIEIQ